MGFNRVDSKMKNKNNAKFFGRLFPKMVRKFLKNRIPCCVLEKSRTFGIMIHFFANSDSGKKIVRENFLQPCLPFCPPMGNNLQLCCQRPPPILYNRAVKRFSLWRWTLIRSHMFPCMIPTPSLFLKEGILLKNERLYS